MGTHAQDANSVSLKKWAKIGKNGGSFQPEVKMNGSNTTQHWIGPPAHGADSRMRGLLFHFRNKHPVKYTKVWVFLM